jgi:hypothetical protein
VNKSYTYTNESNRKPKKNHFEQELKFGSPCLCILLNREENAKTRFEVYSSFVLDFEIVNTESRN